MVTKSLKQWIFVEVLIFVKEIDVIKKNLLCMNSVEKLYIWLSLPHN